MRVGKKLLTATLATVGFLGAGGLLFADLTGVTANQSPIVVGKLVEYKAKDDGVPPLNTASSINWYLICNKGACAPQEKQLESHTNSQSLCTEFVGDYQMKVSANFMVYFPSPSVRTSNWIQDFTSLHPDNLDWEFNPDNHGPWSVNSNMENTVEVRWKPRAGNTYVGPCIAPVAQERIWRSSDYPPGDSQWTEWSGSLAGAWMYYADVPGVKDWKRRDPFIRYGPNNTIKPDGTLVDVCYQDVRLKWRKCCADEYYTCYFNTVKVKTFVYNNGTEFQITIENIPPEEVPPENEP
jgi:hypothetical protein